MSLVAKVSLSVGEEKSFFHFSPTIISGACRVEQIITQRHFVNTHGNGLVTRL